MGLMQLQWKRWRARSDRPRVPFIGTSPTATNCCKAALGRWEVLATERLISSVESSGEPAEVRLRRLVDSVTTGLADRRAELELLAGIDHPVVSAAVRRVTEASSYLHRDVVG